MNDLPTLLHRAARELAPLWPLDEFVAVNPLLDATDENFARVLTRWGWRHGVAPWPREFHLTEARRRGLPLSPDDVVDEVRRPRPGTALERSHPNDPRRHDLARRLVGATLLEAVTTSQGDAGLWSAVPGVLSRRGTGGTGSRRERVRVLQLLHRSPTELAGLLGLRSEEDVVEEFARHFARLPGWSGWAKWNDTHPRRTHAHRLSLAEFLTLSLAVDAALLEGVVAPAPEIAPLADLIPAHLSRLEAAVEEDLLQRLHPVSTMNPHPRAQFVLCIDPRSEPLRRALEHDPDVETFGVAGFFGLPVVVRPPGLGVDYDGLPALLDPLAHLVSSDVLATSSVTTRLTLDALGTLTHEPEAMFALAEVSGWAASLVTLLAAGRPDLIGRRTGVGHWYVDSPQRVDLAEGALRQIGLVENFAPHVVVLGHAGLSVANAHYATLECGACGAHPGGPNAAGLAELLNDPNVRDGLRERGIDIPENTRVYAGEHLTTLGLVDLDEDIPEEIRSLLDESLERVRLEQATRLGYSRSHAHRDLRRRAHDWSEVRPEWGLCGHVGLVIGPRRFTRGADLAATTFLHSYDASQDPDGTLLGALFSGPLVVAHWINAAYYFSSVAPETLGAGDKTLLNPVSDFAVVSGDDPDLRLGLPRQSLEREDGPEHLPVRLLVLVDAPREILESALRLAPGARNLVIGDWVRLLFRASPDEPWTTYAVALQDPA